MRFKSKALFGLLLLVFLFGALLLAERGRSPGRSIALTIVNARTGERLTNVTVDFDQMIKRPLLSRLLLRMSGEDSQVIVRERRVVSGTGAFVLNNATVCDFAVPGFLSTELVWEGDNQYTIVVPTPTGDRDITVYATNTIRIPLEPVAAN
jgi:hypothetical protein